MQYPIEVVTIAQQLDFLKEEYNRYSKIKCKFVMLHNQKIIIDEFRFLFIHYSHDSALQEQIKIITNELNIPLCHTSI